MSEKNIIYKLKNNKECLQQLLDNGWQYIPETNNTLIFKYVRQPLDSDLVQGSLNNIYNNPEWKEKFYKKHKKILKEKLDLEYNYWTDKAKLSKEFCDILTLWNMQCSIYDDCFIGFTSLDPFDTNVYYNKKILDKYCTEEIHFLLENNLIEEFVVENN
ncbi:hypothetical protein [Mammaliicoccus vitulinus]|uniref:hypothetical protein n=1 Tax=Mammaliicoccus vitulinus TaxID=71237 RepID=UPI00248B9D2E|nr:hypothetical protein [Mammaliicoccus vitulinus]